MPLDDKTFQSLLDQQPEAASGGTAPQGGEFSQALSASPAQPSQPAPAPQQPLADNGTGGEVLQGAFPQNAAGMPDADNSITDPSRPVLDGVAAGAANAAFQTKDFLTGATPEDQKSDARKNAEATKPEDGLTYSLSKGVAQFGVGLLGAGKLLAAAKGIRAVGAGVEALEGVKGGSAALEATKAATVGAIAFDPHAERLSNLIQSSPALSNPVNAFLAAKPDDSAAAGRMKNAMESLGMDAALIGVVGATMKGYKALAAWKNGTGSAEEAVKATADVGGAMDDHNAVRERQEASAPAPDAQQQGVDQPALSTPEGDSAPPLTITKQVEGGNAPVPAPESETHTDLSGRTFTKESPEQPWVAEDGEPANDNAGNTTGAAQTDSPSTARTTTDGAGSLSPVLPEQARSIYEGTASDLDALSHFGSWDAAIDGGHIFGKGGSIPYQKLAGGEEGRGGFEAFITNTAEQLKGRFDAAKGGEVLSDAHLSAMVQQRYKLYGEDPAELMGVLTRAGTDANSLVANMEASYGVAQRGYQDAYTLAARIKAGDLSGFDGVSEAHEGLRQRIEVAATAWESGQAMRAASGRALRRLRTEFRLQQADVDALRTVDPDALVELLSNTGGDPRALREITKPGILAQVKDAATLLYTNNLLWSWKTHSINFATNFYMVGARPMERILGGLGREMAGVVKGDALEAIRTQRLRDMKAYTYMASNVSDAWKQAKEAFASGDSIIAPHSNASSEGHLPDLGKQIAQMPWKPMDSVGNVFANALMVAAPKAVIFPSRAIGGVDEFVKNLSYRSTVQARAHVEGIENGLAGDDLTQFVRNQLYAAFDDAGRAIDMKALGEAKIATFQQDLLPNTLGKAVQNMTSTVPGMKFILPFVRTPTNVLRYGWKLTPGLNLLQSEYRQMITGAMGSEQQSQAVGQMMMGGLFMGVGMLMHHQGAITGGGPQREEERRKLMLTGWKPYSFVSHGADGTVTYTPYGRADPIAMPFGMMADLGDIVHAHYDSPDSKIAQSIQAMATAIVMGVAKSFEEKGYLKSVDDTIQTIQGDKSASQLAGTFAANMIPASSLWRTNNPDRYTRQARTFMDTMMKDIPGFSATLPPKRDAFGDPVTAYRGYMATSKDDVVHQELTRMGDSPEPDGKLIGPPAARFKGGVDLRDVQMTTGQNAYDRYQELARQPAPGAPPIKDVVAKIMGTTAYRNAPDGDASTKGTKLSMVANPMRLYREKADKVMMGDKNVRDAAYKKQMSAVSAMANTKSNQNPTTANATHGALGNLQGAFTSALSSPPGGVH